MTRLRSPVAGVELIPEGLLLVEGENLGGSCVSDHRPYRATAS